MESAAQLEPRDYLRALVKRWVLMVLFTLTVTLAGGVYSLTMPAKYTATARVLMRPQVPTVSVVVKGQRRGLATTQLSLSTYAKLLTSSENAKRVAQRLAARTSGDRIIADPAEIVRSLRATTEPPDVIAVHAEASTPEQAIAFANEAADSFVVIVGDFQRAYETAARQFVESQLQRTTEEIDRVTAQLEKLREESNISPAVAPAVAEGSTQYVSLLQRYTDQLKQVRSQVAATEADLQRARDLLSKTQPYEVATHPAPNPLRQNLEKQLVSYQAALADMLGRYTEDHPAVQDLKDRIKELQTQIEALPPTVEETTATSNASYFKLQSEITALERKLAELQAKESSLRQTVTELTGEAKSAARLQQKTEELTARLRLLRDMQRQLAGDLQVHKMNEAIKSEGAAVLDRAVTAQSKTPRLSKALLFSFVLGLAASCGLAIFFELIDDTIHDPDDLRRYTELVYLGMVPRLEQTESPLVVVASPKSPYAEAYRSIRSQVNFRLWEKPGKVLLVTSALASEGKTMTVANLGAAYAQAGQSVILVDTDLRRPALHHMFDLDNSRGFTNVIVGEAKLTDVLHETGVTGLRVVPSGPLPPNPARLLESERAGEALQQARDMADLVMLDSPPCLVLTDATILSSHSDHVIMVVQAGQLNARELQRAQQALEAGRAPILGVVLNRVPLSRGGYYYYYYYYYYGYGQELREADLQQQETTQPPQPPEDDDL
ncbi:MAG: polysaccharide biosynthesis tyrosine autokinase [Armatimonadetes bacterium]|nr:polysaccharide biosynthesis tyrosine autokinase [Armatimonadota bacterium]